MNKFFHVTEPVARERGLQSEYKVFLCDPSPEHGQMCGPLHEARQFLNNESTYGGPVGRADYAASDSPDFPSGYWIFQGSHTRDRKLSRDDVVAKLAKLLEK